MKILFWTELFWPYIGGVEVLSMQLIAALQKCGHQFLVLATHGERDLPDEETYRDIAIHRFPFQRALLRRDLKTIKTIRERITALKQSFRPDLIHLNTGQPSVFFHECTRDACAAPTLFTIHSPVDHATDRNSLLGRVLNSSDWVAGISNAMLDDARKLIPEIVERSSVVYNGLEMPALKPAPLDFDAPRLLCLGRVIADKGFDLALDAFASLAGRFPRARLVIAGDGEAQPDLKRHAVELQITDKVDFLGWVDPEKVPELLNTSVAVVVPSRWREPFGLVALQAAQMARPVVANRVGGMPEVVADRQTGLLVEPENSATLAEAIAFLLDHPETAKEMGRAGRVRAQELFGFSRFVNAYDGLYKKLRADSPIS
jgi:glycosyltransferase involved in cell wall biosynthesis